MNKINPDEPFYMVGQASKLLGITSDRLRTYEEEGLIKPYRTNNSKDGKRMFTPNDIEWLSLIRDLIKLGVSIPTIRILLLVKYPVSNKFLKPKDLEIIGHLKKLKAHPCYLKTFKI